MDAAIAALLQASTIPVAPPSPPMIYAPPPVIRSVVTPNSDQRRPQRTTIEVEVRTGSEVLWSGQLAVSASQGATFTRRLSEASTDDCQAAGYVSPMENMLSVQLGPFRQVESDGPLSVAVRWVRPTPPACPIRGGSRTVEINDAVVLTPGRSVSLNGDGGLSVRLRRR